MIKLIGKAPVVLFFVFCMNAVSEENLKPQVTILHSGTTSISGKALSYPAMGSPKMILAQVVFPIGAKLPMHTHPAPILVHVLAGELTSERPNGESVIYKAGDSFLEAPNSPHQITNIGKRPAIVYAVAAGAEGMGPITVFVK